MGARGQDERAEDEADELDLIHPQQRPGAERDEQDRCRREAQGTNRGTRVQVSQAREDQGQERRRERRTCARSRILRVRHRG